MSEVRVEIDGRTYRMACGEGEEERLKRLAAELDATVASLRGKLGELGDRRIMVMAALTVLDRLQEAEAALAELKERNRTLEFSREQAVLAAEAEDEPLIARIEALTATVDRVTALLHEGVRRTKDGEPATFGKAPPAATDGSVAAAGPERAATAQPRPERVAPPAAAAQPRPERAAAPAPAAAPQRSVPAAPASERTGRADPPAAAQGDLDRIVPSFLKRS